MRIHHTEDEVSLYLHVVNSGCLSLIHKANGDLALIKIRKKLFGGQSIPTEMITASVTVCNNEDAHPVDS